MMLLALFPLFIGCLTAVTAELDSKLTGTWTTKSRDVVTGPAFYDPIRDRFMEPSHTGISYSFTDDGYYEQAYYRAIPNPSRPDCPKGLMQFQHGEYTVVSNGSLILTPIAVDGRQLLSDPCKGDTSSYHRYNQTEILMRYEVRLDDFHNVQRLNLFEHDGTPMHPMFLIYKPPQMLPTTTLNPIVKETSKSKSKRGASDDIQFIEPLNKEAFINLKEHISGDRLWWLGAIMTSIGGVVLLVLSLTGGNKKPSKKRNVK